MNNTYMRAQEAPLVTNETMEAIDATQGAVNWEVRNSAANAKRLRHDNKLTAYLTKPYK
jgi:hypothetical protein